MNIRKANAESDHCQRQEADIVDEPNSLTSAERNCELIVEHIDAETVDEIRLKRLGICEGRSLQLVHTGDPLIIVVAGARVGVSRILAQRVQVKTQAIAAQVPKG